MLCAGVGPYSEVALFHKSSKTLLLVDSAVCVPASPPAVIPQWALADAGDSSNFFVRLLYGDASPEVRRVGWCVCRVAGAVLVLCRCRNRIGSAQG